MAKMVEYKDVDVLVAARRRIAEVFDRFDNVVASVSSGKDSTVLFHLVAQEAALRERRIKLFFLDQEAEYRSTVDLMSEWMRHPLVDPLWYQVPILMTNATSHDEVFLDAWNEGKEWVHRPSPLAIRSIDGKYPNRFYKFFEWLERQFDEPTAMLVGLRSKESLTRFRSVTNNPGFDGIPWSTRTKSPSTFRFYPIYDWTFGDVWKLIDDEKLTYNRVYDRMFLKCGQNMSSMRVSNLIHEKSFRALADLQEFEPDTYERLVRRLRGVHSAALYARDRFVYDASELPTSFQSWKEYRDYLLATTPSKHSERFAKRFAGQPDDESVHQQQAKQILLNDHENNVSVRITKRDRLRRVWWDRL